MAHSRKYHRGDGRRLQAWWKAALKVFFAKFPPKKKKRKRLNDIQLFCTTKQRGINIKLMVCTTVCPILPSRVPVQCSLCKWKKEKKKKNSPQADQILIYTWSAGKKEKNKKKLFLFSPSKSNTFFLSFFSQLKCLRVNIFHFWISFIFLHHKEKKIIEQLK